MNNLNLFHTLKGENIYFKELNKADIMEIHSYASDEEVSRFIGWKLMCSLEETLHHIETMKKRELDGTHLYASIVDKSTNSVIGTVMIFNFDKEANHAEIGYVLDKKQWGKGFGMESVKLISQYAFEELNLHKLHASVVAENVGSARVLEKNRYLLEGRLKDHYFIEDKYYDALIYGKLQSVPR